MLSFDTREFDASSQWVEELPPRQPGNENLDPFDPVNIDDRLNGSGFPQPAFVMIDVYGFESRMVSGMECRLSTGWPKVLMIETR